MILTFTTSTDYGSAALIEIGDWRTKREPFQRKVSHSIGEQKESRSIDSPKMCGHAQWQRKPNSAPMTSDILLPKINQLMKKAKITPRDLKAVAVDHGPGSFTGSRIAVNIAKTMAYTLGIPVLPFSSLEILAEEIAAGTVKRKIFSGMKILSVLDAHRSLAYVQLFEMGTDDHGQNDNVLHGRFHAKPLAPASAEPLSRILEIIGQAGKDSILVRGLPPKGFRPAFDEIGVIVDEAAPSAKRLALLATRAFPLTQPDDQSWRGVEPTYIRSPDAVEKLQQK